MHITKIPFYYKAKKTQIKKVAIYGILGITAAASIGAATYAFTNSQSIKYFKNGKTMTEEKYSLNEFNISDQWKKNAEKTKLIGKMIESGTIDSAHFDSRIGVFAEHYVIKKETEKK